MLSKGSKRLLSGHSYTRLIQVNQFDEMVPGQQSRQYLDCFVIENFGEKQHIKQIAAAKSLPVLGGKLIANQHYHFSPVFGSYFLRQLSR